MLLRMHVETWGTGPRVVLVHGSVNNGSATWAPLRPLAERFTLVVLNRPGFPPNRPAEPGWRLDFEEQAGLVAELVEPGDHLVGHSYGGVISLFVAARCADRLRSLALLEPPATRVALEHPAVAEFAEGGAAFWASGPRDPRAFLAAFLARVGSSRGELPDPLPPDLEQGARTLMVERGPWEADPPLEAVRAAPWPKLVVSGGHSDAFEAICDVLTERLDAERATCPGAGHGLPRAPGLGEVLERFLRRSSV
jgi:pimeloyl-ACP methyl ester carboxylesterase